MILRCALRDPAHCRLPGRTEGWVSAVDEQFFDGAGFVCIDVAVDVVVLIVGFFVGFFCFCHRWLGDDALLLPVCSC